MRGEYFHTEPPSLSDSTVQPNLYGMVLLKVSTGPYPAAHVLVNTMQTFQTALLEISFPGGP